MSTETDRTRATIIDVSRRAKVSVGTVSRVLNNKGPVSERAIRAVNQAIRELDYRPNTVAQSLRRNQTRVIGCLVPDIVNPVFSKLVKGAEEALLAAGYIILVATSGSRTDKELEILKLFEERQVDGLMLSIVDERNEGVAKALRQADVPIVSLDRDLPVPCDAVRYAHAESMVAAINHLFGLGHNRIALITGGYEISVTRERIAGYRQAFRQAGRPVDEDLIRTGSVDERHGYEQGIALLSRSDPPTALIAGANQLLVGVMRAMREIGLAMGPDVSVISCDDTILSELATPAVTVISRDIDEYGRTAAELLLARLLLETRADQESANRAPYRTTLPWQFIIRDSCVAISSHAPAG